MDHHQGEPLPRHRHTDGVAVGQGDLPPRQVGHLDGPGRERLIEHRPFDRLQYLRHVALSPCCPPSSNGTPRSYRHEGRHTEPFVVATRPPPPGATGIRVLSSPSALSQEQPPRLVAVTRQLGGELLDRVEPAISSNSVLELDPYGFAVEVAVEVEHVDLDQRPSRPRRGTSDGDRRRWPPGGARRCGSRHQMTGVDAVGRHQHRLGDRHVGGGEPEFAATAVAVHDGATHLVGTPEHPVGASRRPWCRARRMAVELTCSSSRAGWPSSPTSEWPCTSKPSPAAHLAPAAPRHPPRRCPKWKSSPTTMSFTFRQPTSTCATKSSADSERSGLVEVDHHHVVDAGRAEQLQLLVEVGEQAGRRVGPDHLGGMAVEGDHGAAVTTRSGPAHHLGDHRAVSEVEAVVGADGDHRALWAGTAALRSDSRRRTRMTCTTAQTRGRNTTDGFTEPPDGGRCRPPAGRPWPRRGRPTGRPRPGPTPRWSRSSTLPCRTSATTSGPTVTWSQHPGDLRGGEQHRALEGWASTNVKGPTAVGGAHRGARHRPDPGRAPAASTRT